MSRDVQIEYVPIQEKKRKITYKCDKCGKILDHDGHEEDFPNELIILLNQEECVSQKFRKDLCTECLVPIWQAICEVLGVDPGDISGSDFDND